ncbi:MAG: M23 family metallopeptidase [Desulfovibrio sp.]|uniref:M23 family metallopeptidase n=1 Tax=Desulfovibrio sp. TaxID=885 RepID=UPI00135E2DA3|nr:M23 family metallopeptidase [Desulfovibrio sp.]MTJ92611.1 M23 family metallopeptidase [Desulfovibrio sp.]
MRYSRLFSIAIIALITSACVGNTNPHTPRLDNNADIRADNYTEKLRKPVENGKITDSSTSDLHVMPTKGTLSSNYGNRKLSKKKKAREHKGVDLSAKRGAAVVSAATGHVTFAGRKGAYGYMIEIDHGNGLVTRYAHLDKITVKGGVKVKAGQTIGTVGRTGRTTGVNLHFEVLKFNQQVDPLSVVCWG